MFTIRRMYHSSTSELQPQMTSKGVVRSCDLIENRAHPKGLELHPSMHRSPTRWVFSGTGLELVTRPATIRYLDHSASAAT
ncbi:hypothetical protein TNCV_4972521 [Trichonephila clavipes]|nr:hypothetical protein TNCV_4972521 [Trichonephila clavipes]